MLRRQASPSAWARPECTARSRRAARGTALLPRTARPMSSSSSCSLPPSPSSPSALSSSGSELLAVLASVAVLRRRPLGARDSRHLRLSTSLRASGTGGAATCASSSSSRSRWRNSWTLGQRVWRGDRTAAAGEAQQEGPAARRGGWLFSRRAATDGRQHRIYGALRAPVVPRSLAPWRSGRRRSRRFTHKFMHKELYAAARAARRARPPLHEPTQCRVLRYAAAPLY